MVINEERDILSTVNKSVALENDLNFKYSELNYAFHIYLVCSQQEEIINDVQHALNDAKVILTDAKTNHLSSTMMTKATLTKHIESIPRRGSLTPLWSKREAGNYYWSPIAKTIYKDLSFTTHLSIPLVDHGASMLAYPTTRDSGEKILIDSRHSHYRYLSGADMERCRKMHTGQLLCRGRLIQIKDTLALCDQNMDCSLGRKLPYARVIEIAPNTIAYRFKEKQTAVMQCSGEQAMTISMKEQGILTPPRHCSIANGILFVKEMSQVATDEKLEHESWSPSYREEEVDNTKARHNKSNCCSAKEKRVR